MQRRIKVFFVLPNLLGGGAQRVTLNIINNLNYEKFKPTLVVLTTLGDYSGDISEDIELIHIGSSHVRYSFPELIKILREEEPDIIYSSLNYVNSTVILAREFSDKSIHTVVSEHNYLSRKAKVEAGVRNKVWLMKFTYPKADKVVCVSEGMGKDLKKTLKLSDSKIKIIYNPVVNDNLIKLSRDSINSIPWFREDSKIPVILAAGRLTYQKGFKYLIHAFSLLKNNASARLCILGKGKERENLEKLAGKLGVNRDIMFLGFRDNPYKFMRRASIFVLSSLYEGLPTVLIEAMACGTPVVSTDCPSGPDEIITDEVNGLLVPTADAESLADALIRLIKDKTLAKTLAENGRERADDFRVEKIVKEYEILFKEVLKEEN